MHKNAKPIRHGHLNGYSQHLYRREQPCDACRTANRDYQRERVAARGSARYAAQVMTPPKLNEEKLHQLLTDAHTALDRHADNGTWTDEAICAGLGGQRWDTLPTRDQIAVCQECPVRQACLDHGRAIVATGGLVFGGRTFIDGRPTTLPRTWRARDPHAKDS